MRKRIEVSIKKDTLTILKNKINSFKGSVYYQFFPEKAMYLEISELHAKNLENSNRLAAEGAALEAKEMDYPALNSFE